MAAIHEMYGRLSEQHELVLANYHKTIGLLQEIKAGKVDLDCVEVTRDGWKVIPKASSLADLKNVPAHEKNGRITEEQMGSTPGQ